jgi:hypothetical protein
MANSTVLTGSFQDLERTADTLDQLRALGIADQDITILSSLPYSPRALGRPHIKTWLPLITLASAVAGLLVGLFFAVVTPYLYVIRVGGQPIAPAPPTALLLYAFTMLVLIVGTFTGVVILNNLPTTGPRYDGPAPVDDRISVLFRCSADKKEAALEILETQGAEGIDEPARREV